MVFERVHAIVLDPAGDAIDPAQASEGFEKQAALADGQVGRLDERKP